MGGFYIDTLGFNRDLSIGQGNFALPVKFTALFVCHLRFQVQGNAKGESFSVGDAQVNDRYIVASAPDGDSNRLIQDGCRSTPMNMSARPLKFFIQDKIGEDAAIAGV